MLKMKSLLRELKRMGIDEHVLEAMKKVDRKNFIRQQHQDSAYANHPLPIGKGQTISQPYTVAYMIQLLEIENKSKILEIGAGSGYNAAIMAKLAPDGKVYSIEIIKELAEFAQSNLKKAGIKNVEVIHGNGYEGYEKEAPYDRIIATAASKQIPPALKNQLKDDGIMVIPINRGVSDVMTKVKAGKKTTHGRFRFVPFKK